MQGIHQLGCDVPIGQVIEDILLLAECECRFFAAGWNLQGGTNQNANKACLTLAMTLATRPRLTPSVVFLTF